MINVWAMSANAYRIYVVEDSPILLRLLRDMLSGIPGARFIGHADRADKAITEIVEKKPDAIIVDLMLETGTGFDVLEAVGQQSAKAPLAIVLTNFTMPPHPEWAERLGASYFFDKGTEILQMFRVMRELVEKHQKTSNRNHSHG